MSAFVFHDAWPYNLLNIRRDPHPDAEIVAIVPYQWPWLQDDDLKSSGQCTLEPSARFRLFVDEAASNDAWWKLAPRTEAGAPPLPDAMRRSDFDVATEGWVVKEYGEDEDHLATTLQPLVLPRPAEAGPPPAAPAAEPGQSAEETLPRARGLLPASAPLQGMLTLRSRSHNEALYAGSRKLDSQRRHVFTWAGEDLPEDLPVLGGAACGGAGGQAVPRAQSWEALPVDSQGGRQFRLRHVETGEFLYVGAKKHDELRRHAVTRLLSGMRTKSDAHEGMRTKGRDAHEASCGDSRGFLWEALPLAGRGGGLQLRSVHVNELLYAGSRKHTPGPVQPQGNKM